MKRVIMLLPAIMLGTATARGQYPPGLQGSPNVHVQYHLPLTGGMDTRIDQDLSRPYVYFSHRTPAGFHIIDIKDPRKSSVIYSWQIENPELAQGSSTGVMLFKLKGRHYSIASMQLGQNGPASDVVAVIHDMTGLPDTTKVKEVARIRNLENKGGSHEAFSYNSDGRALFFTTVARGGVADIYDLEKVIAAGTAEAARVGRIPVPDGTIRKDVAVAPIYHDFFVGYDPATHQDKFYGAGWQAVGRRGELGRSATTRSTM
ncbi:MAG: hypothetical protein HY700_21320 [Gemmatimonadetes bacterium]|nr:hypothetical protein [Gemmatimonadota bacterium]